MSLRWGNRKGSTGCFKFRSLETAGPCFHLTEKGGKAEWPLVKTPAKAGV